MYRAKYENNNRLNHVLAKAIFTPSLQTSHALLRDTIWSPHLDAAAFQAVMSRADTAFEYVRKLMQQEPLPAPWTRERLLAKLLDPKAPSIRTLVTNSKSSVIPDAPSPEASKLPWTPRQLPAWDTERFPWFWTVYYRVLGAHYLLHAYKRFNQPDRVFEHKIRAYIDAHLACCILLDASVDADAELVCAAYGAGLGESHYACDADFVLMTSREHVLKPTPYSQIAHLLEEQQQQREEEQTAYLLEPQLEEEWSPFPDARPETHSMYFKLVAQLNRCMQHMPNVTRQLADQLWLYYASWTDLFRYCIAQGRMDDEFLLTPIGSRRDARFGNLHLNDTASPWALFGGWAQQGTRAFCGDDLPDLYGMLSSIPLRGEQHTPPYVLGKIYQKALPFACGRRHIIKLIALAIRQNPGLEALFSKLCWVMFANLYPGELAAPHGTQLGMRDLIRIKELTENRDELLAALAVRKPSPSGAPLIVFTLFRLHILHIASFNPQYVTHASECIDWEFFKQDSIKLANLIRQHRLFAADCFATARLQLGKTVKTPNARVHRMRRRSAAVSIMDHFNEKLEKSLLKTQRAFQQELCLLLSLTADRYYASSSLMAAYVRDTLGIEGPVSDELLEESRETARLICQRYETALNVRCKSAILNALIELPPEQRMTASAFAMLKAPEMGGISDQCVAVLCDLVRTYEHKAAPKEFKQRIGMLELDHFLVVCFFFNAAALVDRISFSPLDADTVRRTDAAIMARLVPGTPFNPEAAYGVHVALCCERICTLTGMGKYGNREVAYDVEQQCFICAAGKKHADDPVIQLTAEDDENVEAGDNADNINADDDNNDDDDDDDEDDADDLIGQLKGTQTARDQVMHERKTIRNLRKRFSRIPCGQPVLRISLRGRALIWGNTAENKRQYMFCPQCAALHVYSVLGFCDSPTGEYRCPECARRDLSHLEYHTCAYCKRPVSNPEDWRPVHCPNVSDARDLIQRLYFCKSHLRIVHRHSSLPKPELWKRIKQLHEQRALLHAGGNHKTHTDRTLMLRKR